MINGHGDDTYAYGNIRLNFSSNIPAFADLSVLEDYLRVHVSKIRSYPEPSPCQLEEEIARKIGRNPAEVLVTSGATEAIYLIAHCFSQGERTYTVVHPTFSEYDSACHMFGMTAAPRGDICWICNPNNPTGKVWEESFVKELAQNHRFLIIDQSYEDYTLESLSDMSGADNVMVLHSMTKKYGVPGLRLGYITAPSSIIGRLRSFCHPWAVNSLAIEAGLWLVRHNPQWVDITSYLQEAQNLCGALNEIPGIQADQTQTNFMLCTIQGITSAVLKEYLVHEYGILIRDASNFPGLTPYHFRVAAQLPEEDKELVNAIAQCRSSIIQ